MGVFGTALTIILLIMTATFVVAMIIKDNSIVDIVYGLAFVLSCWAAFLCCGEAHPRALLALGLVTLWGIRLAGHGFLRKRGEEEDFRYRKWREQWGSVFVPRSFLQIFMLQGVVVFLVALPVLLVIRQPGGALGWLDIVGTLVWLLGFAFEAVGDFQLMRFKSDPSNKGRIMQSGLWRYSRHPNYFGEAILWWGVFLIALGVPYGWAAVVSPMLIDFLLLKVSGIPMLEAKYEGVPEFEAYKQRTNAFFPWIPGKG
ncbi:MAG: DUF1295 domain-containing protein [Desulfuromonadales bacterium]